MQTLPNICPDRGLSQSPSFAVDEVRFGDGYVQSRPSGINSVREAYQISWSLLTKDEYHELFNFLSHHKGVYAFWWQPPWADYVMKWKCKDFSGMPAQSAKYGSINATFEQDLNP